MNVKAIKLLTVLLAVIAVLCTSCSTSSEFRTLSTEQKLEDFEYMYNTMEKHYPYFEMQKRKNGIDWLANKDQYLQWVKDTTEDREFYGVLDKILGQLKHGHTKMISPFEYHLVLGYWNRNAEEGWQPWISIMVKETCESNPDANPQTIQKELEASHQRSLEDYASASEAYEYWDRAFADIFGEDAGEFTMQPPEYQILEDGKVAYIRIESFAIRGEEAGAEGLRIRSFLQQISDYPYLVIDVRGNRGGWLDLWEDHLIGALTEHTVQVPIYECYKKCDLDILREINGESLFSVLYQMSDIGELPPNENYPPEIMTGFEYFRTRWYRVYSNNCVDFSGKIFLLVDGDSFSSTERFAVVAKASGWATLVGSHTGGSGLEPYTKHVKLPNSGLLFRMPIGIGLSPDGTVNTEVGTKPDIEIGPDEDALETVLEIIHEASGD